MELLCTKSVSRNGACEDQNGKDEDDDENDDNNNVYAAPAAVAAAATEDNDCIYDEGDNEVYSDVVTISRIVSVIFFFKMKVTTQFALM